MRRMNISNMSLPSTFLCESESHPASREPICARRNGLAFARGASPLLSATIPPASDNTCDAWSLDSGLWTSVDSLVWQWQILQKRLLYNTTICTTAKFIQHYLTPLPLTHDTFNDNMVSCKLSLCFIHLQTFPEGNTVSILNKGARRRRGPGSSSGLRQFRCSKQSARRRSGHVPHDNV